MSITDLIPWKRNKNVSVNKSRSFHSSLQNEVNRLFDNFGRNWDVDFPFNKEESSVFYPDINLSENENEYVVTAELPGMDEKDVNVELKNGGLTIKGEKKSESEAKKQNGYIYSERTYGSFYRQIPLPEEIDPDSVEAKFKNGVLTITLPKTEKAKAGRKKIDIKAE